MKEKQWQQHRVVVMHKNQPAFPNAKADLCLLPPPSTTLRGNPLFGSGIHPAHPILAHLHLTEKHIQQTRFA